MHHIICKTCSLEYEARRDWESAYKRETLVERKVIFLVDYIPTI